MKKSTLDLLLIFSGIGIALTIVALVFPFILNILVRVLS